MEPRRISAVGSYEHWSARNLMVTITRQPTLAIDLGREIVRAVCVKRGRSLVVTGTLLEQLPETVERDDASSVGLWLKERLRKLGVNGGPAVFVLERDIVSIRRVEIPSTDPDELPDMVRMSIERDLPIDAEDAIIDYIPVHEEGHSTIVHAVAISRRDVDRIHMVAAAAGIDVAAITLRCLGSVYLAGRSEKANDGVLAIDVTGEGLEFIVCNDRELLFSRGVGMQGEDGAPPDAEQLSIEARRSWLSYRVSRGDLETPRAIVLGGEHADEIVKKVQENTGLPTQAYTGDNLIQGAGNMRGIWPLAGVLSSMGEVEQIDLNSPRAAPDRAARTRQRLLMMAGIVVVTAGIGWTLGNMQFSAFSESASELESKARGATAEYHEFRRREYRIEHLEGWRSIRPDWLEHLRVVTAPERDNKRVVLESFAGTLEVESTEFDKQKGFSIPASSRLVIEGDGQSQDVVFDLRASMVEDPRYTIRTIGADAKGKGDFPFPFTFSLASPRLDPSDPPPKATNEDVSTEPTPEGGAK